MDELLAEIARWPGCCDELWFATELGFPKMAVHLQSAERMARAAAKARAAGLLPGIQLAASIGHADSPILPSDGIAWQRVVGPDGQVASMCNCPRSEPFHDYLREAIRAYAAFGPSSFWIDDDLRMNHHAPIQYACFCDNCLGQFSQFVGRAWSREPLVAELNSPAGGPLARAMDPLQRRVAGRADASDRPGRARGGAALPAGLPAGRPRVRPV